MPAHVKLDSMLQRHVQLRPGEETVFVHGAGYFPAAAPFSRGGLLVITNQRVLFVPHKLESAAGAKDLSLTNAHVSGIGSTPRTMRVGLPRKWLRIDTESKSWLFLFTIRKPWLRNRAIRKIAAVCPSAELADGWGFIST